MHQTPDSGIGGGVGRTALLVAAARAIETHRTDCLAGDIYAEHFVRAARVSAAWPTRPAQVPDGDANPLWGRFARYFGLRTRVFDDFLMQEASSGVRQIVLLGAGLDTRAYRLEWPAGRVVYEIDRAEVLDFKHDVLGAVAAGPGTARRPIAADLAEDWAQPLLRAGFDPIAPAAWLIEGVLFYLSAAAERHLFDTLDRLSAEGSHVAFEIKPGLEPPEVRDSAIYAETRRQLHIDLPALFDHDPRPDSAGYLAHRGWSVETHTPFDFAARHRCRLWPEPHDALASNRWVFAARSGGDRSARSA
ncbi:SAM-dependent methyltransferase [Nocardia sp. alder85J]|uniref:SAM-dependent methyltransferase n=1 Tax=Nocardia sp. alder85J TaxID=2862949 RepID=UPI001CD42C82|nr:SAM-dependent methyltransferase [Nocardia sp. alder85J]MCX4094659.1 SAM-dependent methyltransferase [Nocardia sp. alder85J]